MVIVSEDDIEDGLTNPGLEMLEGCIHRGIPIPFGELFSQKHSFVR